MKKDILKLMGIALIAALTTLQVGAQDDDQGKPEDSGKQPRKEMKKHQNQNKGGWMNQEGQQDRMKHMAQMFSSLTDEEREKLEKLRQEDPEAFKTELQKIMKEKREKQQQEEAKVRGLVKTYREAKTDEEKQKALAEIKAATEKEFNAKMEANKKGIEQAEKSLEELKKKYEEKMKNAAAIIDDRVKELTKDPALRWDNNKRH